MAVRYPIPGEGTVQILLPHAPSAGGGGGENQKLGQKLGQELDGVDC